MEYHWSYSHASSDFWDVTKLNPDRVVVGVVSEEDDVGGFPSFK
mgnify:CR=1 FL=1